MIPSLDIDLKLATTAATSHGIAVQSETLAVLTPNLVELLDCLIRTFNQCSVINLVKPFLKNHKHMPFQ